MGEKRKRISFRSSGAYLDAMKTSVEQAVVEADPTYA